MRQSQITFWCHEIIRSQAPEGGFYIDATMGKGHDTLFLCKLAGKMGRVLAFDIQQDALTYTEKLLKAHGMESRAKLILDGHEHMGRYVRKKTVDVICFNFGYLPGGSHGIATKADTSIRAVEEGLSLLKPGGMMSLCIYSGGDTGFEEKDALFMYLKTLAAQEYTVISNEYMNRGNCPPVPVFVFKR